jgi:hypothetical protein
LALALQTSSQKTYGCIYDEGNKPVKFLHLLRRKVTHHYCANANQLMEAFEMGMVAGKATARMQVLEELVAIGSSGDFYEAPMKQFLDVFDPTKQSKKP